MDASNSDPDYHYYHDASFSDGMSSIYVELRYQGYDSTTFTYVTLETENSANFSSSDSYDGYTVTQADLDTYDHLRVEYQVKYNDYGGAVTTDVGGPGFSTPVFFPTPTPANSQADFGTVGSWKFYRR